MSIQGFSPREIVKITSDSKPVAYTYAAALTLVVYDTIVLLRREVDYIYRPSQSPIKWIYALIRLIGLVIFAFNLFIYSTPHNGPTWCWARQWIVGFIFEIVYTAIIKTLLVLRLRALYGNNKKVTVVLAITTGIELLSTTYAYIMTGWNLQNYIRIPAPVPGCPLQPVNTLHHFHSPTVVWSARMASNGLELILLLIGLRQSLKATSKHFKNGWILMQQASPLLYVFYRDGTFFYIPIFVLSMFGFIATFTSITEHLACANWEGWLALTYYICGTRLILNIRSAGLKFTSSAITEKISTLAFSHEISVESEDGSLVLSEAGSIIQSEDVPKA